MNVGVKAQRCEQQSEKLFIEAVARLHVLLLLYWFTVRISDTGMPIFRTRLRGKIGHGSVFRFRTRDRVIHGFILEIRYDFRTCCFLRAGTINTMSGFRTRGRAILGEARLKGQDVAGRHLPLGAWVQALHAPDKPGGLQERQMVIER